MPDAGEQFENEVLALLNRYQLEADITYIQALGALEKIKLDLAHQFHRYNDNLRDENGD